MSTPAQATTRPRGPSPFEKLPWVNRPASLHESYGDTMTLLPSRFARVWMAVLAAALAALPFVITDFWLGILNRTAIFAIGAIGLNLLTGFTGQVSLGHAFFLGLGAYTAGYAGGDLGLPVVVWLPLAGLVGCAVGAAVGPFALRLKGLYLAIVTIGLVFLGEHLFLNLRDVTGGPQGRAIPAPAVGALDLGAVPGLSRDQSFALLLFPLAGVAALFAKNVVRTRAGRAFQAVRDREVAASIIGVNVARTKVTAFALSSFYAAAAGALYGSYFRHVVPSRFDLLLSIEFVAMIIVGGVGTVMGSILGAGFLVLVPALVQRFSEQLPFLSTSVGGGGVDVFTFNQILFGVLIVFFLVVEPGGLAGLWRRAKVYFKTWPFSY